MAKAARQSRSERRRDQLAARRSERHERPHSRWVVRALAVAFLVSGSAGLMHEVVWVRLLGFVFGVTELALATVLAAYMGGLALGSWVVGARTAALADGRRTYAWLEIGIGVSALLLPFVLAAVEPVYGAIWRRTQASFAALSVLRFLLAGALLLVPTVMMGATLPVLADHLARVEGRRLAPEWLYTMNLLGAVVGVALAGFVLLPGIGMWGTIAVGGILNVGVGLGVLGLPRLSGPRVEPSPARAPTPVPASTRAPRLLVLAAFASGAVSLATQVAWTRVLTLVIGSTTYAFSSVLVVYLVALGLGSAGAARFAAQGRTVGPALAVLQLASALGTVAAVWAVNRLPFWYVRLYATWGPEADFGGVARGLVLTAMLLLGPVAAAGTVLPLALAGAVPRGGAGVGSAVGSLYATNTLGAILGAVLAGFVLIPTLGTRATLLALAGVSACVGLAFVAERPRSRGLVAGGVVAAGVLVAGIGLAPAWNYMDLHTGVAEVRGASRGADLARTERFVRPGDTLLFQREGPTASVVVREDAQKMRRLVINSRTNASDDATDMATQVLVAQLPLLFAPRTERVFVVGWGSGVTVGSAARTATGLVTAVELEPAVVAGSVFFEHVNLRPLANLRVRLFEDDARHILLASDETWDVVINEPSHPWVAGVANLFTRDYYELVARRLAPDGIVGSWIQSYQISPDTYRSLLATLQAVFPEILVFHAPGTSDTVIVASRRPLAFDLAELERRFAAGEMGLELERIGVDRPEALLAMLYLDSEGARRFAGNARLNTDDNMYVEFRGPRDREGVLAGAVGDVLEEMRAQATPPERLLRDPEALFGSPERREAFVAAMRAMERDTTLYETGPIGGMR